MMDVKVVKYCWLDLESWTGLGKTREWGLLGRLLGGGEYCWDFFSVALLQRGKIHELVCHFSTFPVDAATREFFLQTCEYRSESCYITGSSTPLWMDVASLLMERFSSVLSCSVGKRTWRRRRRWEGCGGWGRLFSRTSSCGEDEIGILSALVMFGSHVEGNPVSSLTCAVMSESHCSTAEVHFFENCTPNIEFSERVSTHDSGNAEFDLKIKFKALARKWRCVCRSLRIKHSSLV